MKEIKLEQDIGQAKKGDIFVQGLHGVPEYYKEKNPKEKSEDWYWKKGTNKEENAFLHRNVVENNKHIILIV